MRAIIVLVVAALTGCSIEHPSDALACASQADCDPSRTCTDGFCVAGAGPACPAGCTTCDLAAKTCALSSSGNGKVTCPDDFHCTLACGNNACRDVDCKGAASCTITCSGNRSCAQITCAGDCDITCSGASSCASVECTDACACDVSCTGGADCGDVRCPAGCGAGDGCTSAPATCNAC